MKATLNNGWQVEGTPAELYELQTKFDAAKKAAKAVECVLKVESNSGIIGRVQKALAEGGVMKPKPKFNPGDKVRVSGNNSQGIYHCRTEGTVGNVLRHRDTYGSVGSVDAYDVNFAAHASQTIAVEDLELYVEPTPKTRAEIVAQAKRDVADLERRMEFDRSIVEGNSTFRNRITKPEFHVNREKRAVTVLAKGVYTGKLYEKAIAKAAPDDVFNAHIGRAISLRRALGLGVPDEYLNAPKPGGVAVGDVVCYEGHRVAVKPIKSGEVCSWKRRGDCEVGSTVARHGKLIDDTDRVESDAV